MALGDWMGFYFFIFLFFILKKGMKKKEPYNDRKWRNEISLSFAPNL